MLFLNQSIQYRINTSGSAEIDGSPMSYSLLYYDHASNVICGSIVIQASSKNCISGTCRHIFDVFLSPCLNMSEFIVTVLATNVFGDGPTASYTVSKVETMPNSCLDGKQLPLTWMAILGLTVLCMLLLSLVLCVVITTLIRSKVRLQRKIQTELNTAEDSPKSQYEEIVLTPQVAPREISTEENVAYVPTLRNQ